MKGHSSRRMTQKRIGGYGLPGLLMLLAALAWTASPLAAQDNSTAASPATVPAAGSVVPRLVQFSGAVTDSSGKPATGPATLTFSLYEAQAGGAPLWSETQTLTLDSQGHYLAMLGSASPQGLPLDLFTTGAARWLGVQPQLPGVGELPRTLLVGVPYALKAADADTLGGLPASAFVATNSQAGVATVGGLPTVGSPSTNGPRSTNSGLTGATNSTTITGSGTANTIAMFTGSSTIGNSLITQSGGAAVIGEALQVPALGTATASAGFNSQPFDSLASAFNSSTKAAVSQHFRWQAEPVGNNTSSPSGKFNLLFASGTGKPAETGLSLSSKGVFTFATGQTFPGTGKGTVTSVGSGAGLTGGPITSSGSLSIATGGVTNAMLQHSSLTVSPGTDLTGGGAVALGGSVSLNLDTTKVPQLGAANSFTASQTIAGNLTLTGTGNGVTFPDGSKQTTASTGTISGVTAGTDLTGGGASGNVTLNVDTSKVPQLTTVNNFTGSNGSGYLLTATNSASGAFGASFQGDYFGGVGLSTTSSAFSTGVFGQSFASSGETFGVQGLSSSTAGVGVRGTGKSSSTEGGGAVGFAPFGVWGDTGQSLSNGAGVLGTADDESAGLFFNNSPSNLATLMAENDQVANSGNIVFEAFGGPFLGVCNIDVSGNLLCSGTVTTPVKRSDGRQVALYSMQSPENWFEDAGSGQLSGGASSVRLESTFAQTVNTSVEYHVFLTPKGDCEGLYVTNETPDGFEVHELRGGRSNIAFDYRIMARRKGYENVRTEDVTARVRPPEIKRRTGAAPQRVMPPLPHPVALGPVALKR